MGLIGRTSTDGSSSAAILDDGTLWVVGTNSDGELGLGDTTNRTEWTQLGTDTDWAKVYMGGGNFFAIKTDGTLYGAGRNEAGTLGLGSAGVKVLTLTPISSAPKTLDIAASTFQTLLVEGLYMLPETRVCILDTAMLRKAMLPLWRRP